MITNLRTRLDGLDGPLVAAAILGLFIALVVLCALYNAIYRSRAHVRVPRRPSLSENHYRLDAAAQRATTPPDTRPADSSRKAGLVPAGGTR